MGKLILRSMIAIFIAFNLLHCADRQSDQAGTTAEEQRTDQFREAIPVWIKGREKEKNLTLGFRAAFIRPEAEEVSIRIAASTLYRVYLNGQFIGHGPARAAHGFYRIDAWPITGRMQEGMNILAIEVAGYNVNSYYLLDQPAFLQAEVVARDQVICATGKKETDFETVIVTERIQKVPRFSFQRPFIESYQLDPLSTMWRNDLSLSLQKDICHAMPEKKLLIRGVTYPDFHKSTPRFFHSQGRIISDKKIEKYWKDRSLTRVGKKLGGYKESDLALNPSLTMQQTGIVTQQMLNKTYDPDASIYISKNNYSIFDFGVNSSGFIGATLSCNVPSTVYFIFDEILSDNDVNFRRLGCINIVSYELEPGSYQVESFEPYTLRYLKIVVLEGDCEVKDIYLREYVNADIARADFHCSNDTVNQIYAAGRETFRQNATDIFMDCPSRERAGWLCDSYFTARVAADLSGNTRIEKNFFENYLLPEKFEHHPPGMLPMCYPADHPDSVFIPNWSLWFVVQLEEYEQRSGDRKMIDALKPRVLQLFHYFDQFKNQDGLLEDLQSWIFVEWSEANKFVKDVNYPTNMLYSSALAAAGRLYRMPGLIEQAEKIRAVIRDQSFNGHFFVDNALRQGSGQLAVSTNTTEVCQYYAFFFDIATPQTHPDLWHILLTEFYPSRKKNNYPKVFRANAFIGNYLRLELLSRYGRTAQLVEESMANFYYMAERTGTLWENVGAYASCNHGFASHVVHVLYRDILGLYHIDFQKKKILLRFSDVGLNQCRGQIPVGDQLVKLAWQKEPGVLTYQVEVPDGYQVEVENQSQLDLYKDSNKVN